MDWKVRPATLCACVITAGMALLGATAQIAVDPPAGVVSRTGLDCGRQPCDAVARGRAAFQQQHLKNLETNGRACADCHIPAEGFQLSPATARARFERLLARRVSGGSGDDALFRPVDADDFREHGDQATDYSNLVENALVRVPMPLPANVRVIDPVTGQPSPDAFVDLWRAVTPLFDVAITGPDGVAPVYPPDPGRVSIMGQSTVGPNPQGGYQVDARFGSLQEQARGALVTHGQLVGEPPVGLLDDLAAFQATLFSSPRVRRLADAMIDRTTPLPDPDPELDGLEQRGKVAFNRACAQCHGGTLHPSTSTSDATLPGIRRLARYHPIFSACPRPATDGFAPCPSRLDRNARTYRITRADGTVQVATTSDPGRLLLTGQPNDLGVFDVPSLRGIGRTAPYFHNNSAATLEDVIDHYEAFFRSVSRRNPPPNLPPNVSSNGRDLDRGFILPDEREALVAYLRRM